MFGNTDLAPEWSKPDDGAEGQMMRSPRGIRILPK